MLSSLFKSNFKSKPDLWFLPTCFFLLVSCAASPGELKKSDAPIRYFGAVKEDWLYRGAQPTKENLAELKKMGIKTVVNFRDEPEWIEWERKEVEALGMKYVSLPWDIKWPVSPALLDKFFETVNDPKNRPVFMHCKRGRDRTGTMSVLSLMHYEGLGEADAKEKAFRLVSPQFHWRPLVNRKIKFFIKNCPVYFSQSKEKSKTSGGG